LKLSLLFLFNTFLIEYQGGTQSTTVAGKHADKVNKY